MIKFFGITQAGPNKPRNEDSFAVQKLKNGNFLAVIADGVGSSKHSDKASHLAVDSVVEFFVQKKPDSNNSLQFLLSAFSYAQGKIEELVKAENGQEIDYDTTLTVAIYNGKKIAFGHSGDGGIIGLKQDGKYVAITKPQKSSDNLSLIPLRAGESKWEFGCSDDELASVILATDGVYDTFFPYLLRGQETEIYIKMAQFFVSSDEQKIRKYLDDAQHIKDDKTVIVISNDKIKMQRQKPEYYAEPNWQELKAEWDKKAYPHLFGENK